MSKALENRVPNASFSFSQPIELRVSELISGVRSDIAIKLFGDDLDTLKKTADRIARGSESGARRRGRKSRSHFRIATTSDQA